MSDVRLESLHKSFKDVVAVDGVDLHIAEGEFFSLLGPSGCGKTTTLRMVGGFEEPTSGSIHIGGRDVSTLPPYKRDVNTVFQSYALFPHLDVFENVAYGLRRRKVPASEIKSRVRDALSLVDLEGFEQRRKNQLSGGQQQRVALARALVNRPQVLLLDEPLGALDLRLRKQMQVELKRIQQEVGITFVYVTHDQEEAMTMSDRIAVMDGGRMQQVGAPHEVYEAPATRFVAGFLGASNMLDGEVQSITGGVATVQLESGESITMPAARLPESEKHIQVGVRPEKLRIHRAESAPMDGVNRISARLIVSTYTGVSTNHSFVTATGASIDVYVQNMEAAGDGPIGVGEDVTLTWEPEHTFGVARDLTDAEVAR